MKKILLDYRINKQHIVQIFRMSFLFFWVLITLINWFFPFSPDFVLAEEDTPTPTVEIDDPVFPEVTPEPETNTCPPLYDVPLAINPHDHFYFIRPIASDTNTSPLPNFRYGYFYPDGVTAHTGVDITSPLHKPILAAGDGKVIFTGYGLLNGGGDKNDPYGLAVLIRHDFSYEDKTVYTVYAHMDRIDVSENQVVKAGDQIGIIGMTGNTSGPHVHFEVRINDSEGGRVQNPELWLAPVIGSGILAGRIENDQGLLLSAQELRLKSLDTGKTYTILTYAPEANIYSDDYYQENFAFGDIPAGEYQVSINYKYKWYRSEITIAPGTVNYIFFEGKKGFKQELPSDPDAEDFS